MSNHQKHIWLVGGGTGGHIVPLLAVADVLKRDKTVVLTYLGESDGREAHLARQHGLRFIPIKSGKLRRQVTIMNVVRNLRDCGRFLAGVMKSYRLIRKQHPTLIFSKGGPVALPVAVAAWLTHTPLISHESDSVLGFSNRIMALFAKRILTGFPAAVYPARYAKKIQHVGIPLRSEFCDSTSIKKRKRPMVLVTGGSQGALAINEAVIGALPQLLQSVDIMHITGEFSYQRCLKAKDALPPALAEHYGVVDFTPDIAAYMKEATIVVSRAGASIFEMASLAKPMLLIPLPTAANNHQYKNAEFFVRHNAAMLLNQAHLTPVTLYEKIKLLLDSPDLQKELREGTRTFMSCHAAKDVADILKQNAQ